MTRILSAKPFTFWGQFIASTGSRYGLKRSHWIDERMDPERSTAAAIQRYKRVPGALGEHRGGGERCLLMQLKPDRHGISRAALVNPRLKLAVELAWPADCLPRFCNWQHFGPKGCYVTALEPYAGSLLGSATDPDQAAAKQQLKPGQTRRYQLTFTVHNNAAGLQKLMKHDGPVTPAS